MGILTFAKEFAILSIFGACFYTKCEKQPLFGESTS